MDELEKLIETVNKMDSEEFVDTFIEWLRNHDDVCITSMSDVISTLLTECNDELSYASENEDLGE